MNEHLAPQRDFMRRLVKELGRKMAPVCAAYASAEDAGVIPRHEKDAGAASHDYAKALWRDGTGRGWIDG